MVVNQIIQHSLYGTGLRQVAKRTSIEAQIQYNFDLPWLFDSEWTVGI